MGQKKAKAKAGKNNLWMVAGGAAIMIALTWYGLRSSNTEPVKTEQAAQVTPTLIATLSPDQFSGKAKLAYQAAKNIPEILAQLPCYCGCMESIGHKNNLFCFADDHGGECDLCQNIALEAQEMNSKGLPIAQIRENIQKTYSHQHM